MLVLIYYLSQIIILTFNGGSNFKTNFVSTQHTESLLKICFIKIVVLSKPLSMYDIWIFLMGMYVEIKNSVLLECENCVTGQMFLTLDVRNHSWALQCHIIEDRNSQLYCWENLKKLKFVISQWLQKQGISSKFYFIYIIFFR